jgi:hypothetical protein
VSGRLKEKRKRKRCWWMTSRYLPPGPSVLRRALTRPGICAIMTSSHTDSSLWNNIGNRKMYLLIPVIKRFRDPIAPSRPASLFIKVNWNLSLDNASLESLSTRYWSRNLLHLRATLNKRKNPKKKKKKKKKKKNCIFL